MSPKILIIKLGYSETLDREVSTATSLGDVLRTTVLLHHFKDCHITWLTDAKAFPLLYKNPFIDRTLPFDLVSVLQLEAEYFDVVVNLEKVPGICALTDKVHAWQKYGYRFNVQTGEAEAYLNSEQALKISLDNHHKRSHGKTWQAALYEMVNAEWRGEPYVLGYEPSSEKRFDIGFNMAVGNKFRSKALPEEKWTQLEDCLKGEYTISHQQGQSNLFDYFDWIASCRLLVTNDSLGLHLAMVLGVRFVAFFGPTSAFEVFDYGLGEILRTDESQYPCMPCYAPSCKNDRFCMDELKVSDIVEAVKRQMEKC
jgi:heptosyltransferase II